VELRRTFKSHCTADKRTLEGMLAFFTPSYSRMLRFLPDRLGGSAFLYMMRCSMSRYPDGFACREKLLAFINPCNKHSRGIAWLEISLACRAEILHPSGISPSSVPHLPCICLTPQFLYPLRILNMHTNYYFSFSLTPSPLFAMMQPAHDTSAISHDGITVDAVGIYSVIYILPALFPSTKTQIIIPKAAAAGPAITVSMTTNAGRLLVPAVQTAKVRMVTQKPPRHPL
jgi:hypothetical protein